MAPAHSAFTLRGLGRCPTLSSLTLVFYVCGFGFNDGTHPSTSISKHARRRLARTGADFALAPRLRRSGRTSPASSSALLSCRAPFSLAARYPEVSDACSIQIEGLDGISLSSGSTTGDFGFATSATSDSAGHPLGLSRRARVGRQRGSARLARRGVMREPTTPSAYAFAGTKAFAVPH